MHTHTHAHAHAHAHTHTAYPYPSQHCGALLKGQWEDHSYQAGWWCRWRRPWGKLGWVCVFIGSCLATQTLTQSRVSGSDNAWVARVTSKKLADRSSIHPSRWCCSVCWYVCVHMCMLTFMAPSYPLFPSVHTAQLIVHVVRPGVVTLQSVRSPKLYLKPKCKLTTGGGGKGCQLKVHEVGKSYDLRLSMYICMYVCQLNFFAQSALGSARPSTMSLWLWAQHSEKVHASNLCHHNNRSPLAIHSPPSPPSTCYSFTS